MSDRVQEQQLQKRMDAERMQKQADKQARQHSTDDASRQQFSQLMKQSGQQQSKVAERLDKHKEAQEQAAKHAQTQKQGQGKKAEAQVRNARLARGGALHQSKVMQQAESFHSMLDAKKQETEGLDQALGKQAHESKTETVSAREERVADLENKAEERRETAKQEARVSAADKGKHNAAISGDKPTGDDRGDGEHGDEAAVDAARRAAGGNEVQTESVQGAAGAKQLPPEVVEALVKQVMIAVGPDGVASFRIELNDGVLQGATLQITANNGKIGLDVAGLDQNAKRLVQASVGQLQRGLEKRGLALDWLAVA